MPAPRKTPLGHDELRHRTRGLGQRHRTVLLLVDGQRSLDALLDMADQAGARPSHFDELVQMGLVALPACEPVEGPEPTAPMSVVEPGPSHPTDPTADAPPASGARPVAGGTERDGPARVLSMLPRWLTADTRPEPTEGLSEEQRLQEVRSLLTQALGVDALLFAPLTLNRVRLARSSRELISEVWEIEHHREHVRRSHAQLLSLQRARELLGMGNTQVNEDSQTTQWPDTVSPERAAS